MKAFAILATLATVGVIAGGGYFFMNKAKTEKAAKEKAAKEQFSYNNVIVKFKDQTKSDDPLAQAAKGYASMGLKKFNEGEKLLEQLEAKPESVSKETVEAIFKSDHPFYRFLQGYCYEKGIGVAADKEKAFENYNESQTQKLPFSKVRHALCLIKGTGIKADPEKGIAELSSMINFADAKVANLATEDGDSYKTNLAPQPSSEYPPSALALARVYLEGDSVPRDPKKAMDCALVAYANGLEGSQKFMDDIFKDALAKASEIAEAKFNSFNESSPEYQAEVKAFHAKNKSLQSMPKLLAKETEKHMKEATQGMLGKLQAEECAKAGWLLALDKKTGISKDLYSLDCAKFYDAASALLCSAQKAAMPPGIKQGMLDCRETAKGLAAKAKTFGLKDELLVLNAYSMAMDARSQDGIKTSDFVNFTAVRTDISNLNANRPTPASLVIERILLTCESDYLNIELADSNTKLQKLEAESPVRTLEFNSREHDRFDKTGKTALEIEADSNLGQGIKFQRSATLSKEEAYAKTVSSAFAVSVNGEKAKNVSREDFGKLKSAYDIYIAEKARIKKIIDRDQKALQLFDRLFANNKASLQAMIQKDAPAEAKAPAAKAAAGETAQ